MDSNYAENPSETFLTLQAGFDELIRNAYLLGFREGREFEFNISREEAKQLDNEHVNYLMSELSPIKPDVLLEAEQLLREYS